MGAGILVIVRICSRPRWHSAMLRLLHATRITHADVPCGPDRLSTSCERDCNLWAR
jgi:hypothetical protein